MAEQGYNAARAARQIDSLVNRSPTQLYTHSPNDVLVQIALPIILILAISTRLTMVAYNMLSQENMAPAVMELWKQQIILRIDRVLNEWERESNLAAFTDFRRVRFGDVWPTDPGYSRLCIQAQDLNDRDALRRAILFAALTDQATATPGAVATMVPPADVSLEPGSPAAVYAEDYINQRIAQWGDRVESLQWQTVERIARELPLGPETGNADARAQLKTIADELARRGFPLVAAVRAAQRGGKPTP